jgi:hypothetical protein
MKLARLEEKEVPTGPHGVEFEPLIGTVLFKAPGIPDYRHLDGPKMSPIPHPHPWVKGDEDDNTIRYRQLE